MQKCIKYIPFKKKKMKVLKLTIDYILNTTDTHTSQIFIWENKTFAWFCIGINWCSPLK